MKSDLTCPVEVMHVLITGEPREDGTEQVVCVIDFHSLEPDKTVDSVQMNIVCYSDDGMRLGGRLVRSHAHDRQGDDFTGTFRPEHVNGTSRVEASVEKVWFNDGVIWRREERNVREYESNQLPEGRELDRLRSVAGPDAVGYAREDDTVWLCVCGRANRTNDEACKRCGRARNDTVTSFSKEHIEATLGVQERKLEEQSQESLRRSAEQNAREMEAAQARQKKQKRRVRRIIGWMIFIILALSAWRWGVPLAADFVAKQRLESGKPDEAKKIYEWVGRLWPDEYGAGDKARAAEQAIIAQMIEIDSEDSLRTAQARAAAIEDTQMYAEASLALAQRYIDQGKTSEAETLLRSLESNAAARNLLQELLYGMAKAAKEKLDFDYAIQVFTELGGYMDSDTQRQDAIYLQARQMMREDRLEEATGKFLQVSGYMDSLELVRRCTYQLAGEKRTDGSLLEAAELYESLGVYEDAKNLGRACRYDAGIAAISAGDLKTAAEQLKLAGDYEDAKERFEEAAFTLGNASLQDGDYETAIYWLEQLQMTEAVQTAYNQAQYAQAQQMEQAGDREDAAILYASLGNYEDAVARAQQIEYDIAKVKMAQGALEEALDRFEGLGKFEDSQTQAENCRREIAERAFESGDYDRAMLYFSQMSDKKASDQGIVRCHYEIAELKAGEAAYKEASDEYKLCGSYLDAEEKAAQMRYKWAESLEQETQYEAAAREFRDLGHYLDAAARAQHCEDLWLGDVYRNAKLDLETGNYVSVLEALEPYQTAELPERYSDMLKMIEEACLGRAQELINQQRPLDALPYLRRISGNRQAQKRLSDYVYRIIGTWKARNGMEFVFRPDGSCTIDGKNLYFGGTGYYVFVDSEPYPTKRTYQVVSLRGNTLVLKEYGADTNLRLSYVGEPTPAEITGPAEDTDETEPDESAVPEGESAETTTEQTQSGLAKVVLIDPASDTDASDQTADGDTQTEE